MVDSAMCAVTLPPAVMTAVDQQQMAQLRLENSQLLEKYHLEREANTGLLDSVMEAQELASRAATQLQSISQELSSVCSLAHLPFLLAADYLAQQTGVLCIAQVCPTHKQLPQSTWSNEHLLCHG